MNPQQSQRIFRTLLNAMSAPGAIFSIDGFSETTPLSPACAAICRCLLDAASPVALIQMPEPVTQWVRTCCRAPSAPAESAAFVIGTGQHWSWDQHIFNNGTEEEPEQGATLILELENLYDGAPLQLLGPGIATTRITAPRLSPGFLSFWQRQQTQYPRGIDLILCCRNECLCLPRSITIQAAVEEN